MLEHSTKRGGEPPGVGRARGRGRDLRKHFVYKGPVRVFLSKRFVLVRDFRIRAASVLCP